MDDDDDDDRARRSRDALSTRRARNIATTTDDDRRPTTRVRVRVCRRLGPTPRRPTKRNFLPRRHEGVFGGV
jgi:hypothetical protein